MPHSQEKRKPFILHLQAPVPEYLAKLSKEELGAEVMRGTSTHCHGTVQQKGQSTDVMIDCDIN
jgi:hypothetical protein